jgi:hypothetical protein
MSTEFFLSLPNYHFLSYNNVALGKLYSNIVILKKIVNWIKLDGSFCMKCFNFYIEDIDLLTIRNWIHSLPKWSICSSYYKTFSLKYSILCDIFTYFATINSREILENRNWIEFSILLTFKFGKRHEPNFFYVSSRSTTTHFDLEFSQ